MRIPFNTIFSASIYNNNGVQCEAKAMETILYMIIPCYNEEKVLPVTAGQFLEELKLLIRSGKVSGRSRILFVDDGSSDRTWKLIRSFAEADRHYAGIRQSRNRGHQNAVLAGLMEARAYADITISIDCDGQDDISAMEEMVDAYHNGYEIVYGVRNKRDTDTWFKRVTAEGFYKFLQLMGVEVVFNHADYRLLHELSGFREVNLFLRGMIPLVGFSSTVVYYERHGRVAGESHYPLHKMLALACDGITSLSIRPIRMITGIGMFLAFLSFCAVVWSVVQYFSGGTVAGWTSMISIICLIGGLQLTCLGVLGEYIGKIYLEVKARPRYIISDRTFVGGQETKKQGQQQERDKEDESEIRI